jgi:hypothetical protein
MLKRAWLLCSLVWAALCLWGGASRADGGLLPKDFVTAFLPLVVGWLLALATRFVVTGSPVRPRDPARYRKP